MDTPAKEACGLHGNAMKLETLLSVLLVAAIIGVPSCIYRHETSPETKARRDQAAARVEAEKLPRKVNEANGCEVWAFKPGDRWLYFTRCATHTETVNTWDECRSVQQGKTTRTVCTPHSMRISQD